MNVLGTINITEKQIAFEKKPNCKFTCAQVIQMPRPCAGLMSKPTGNSDYKAMKPYIDIVDSIKASEMSKMNFLD